VVRDLRKNMERASEQMEFERAAFLRDQIRDIKQISERQQVLRTVGTDQDVIAFARENGSAVVQVFYIRGGKLIGSEPFALQNTEDENDQHMLSSFLTQFYDSAAQVPPNILLADHVEEPLIIEQWLSQKGGHKVEIQVPRRGEKRKLIEMAEQNARQKLEEIRLQWLNSEQRAVAGLSEVRDLIGLAGLPARIECYDISNTQGTNSVGAMVVFEHGEPKKSRYRKFKIKTVEDFDSILSKFQAYDFKGKGETPQFDFDEGDPTLYVIVTASRLGNIREKYASRNFASRQFYDRLVGAKRLEVIDGTKMLRVIQEAYTKQFEVPHQLNHARTIASAMGRSNPPSRRTGAQSTGATRSHDQAGFERPLRLTASSRSTGLRAKTQTSLWCRIPSRGKRHCHRRATRLLSQSFFSIDLAGPLKDIDGEFLVIVRRLRKWFADRLLNGFHGWHESRIGHNDPPYAQSG
jgi:hypothetical protein